MYGGLAFFKGQKQRRPSAQSHCMKRSERKLLVLLQDDKEDSRVLKMRVALLLNLAASPDLIGRIGRAATRNASVQTDKDMPEEPCTGPSRRKSPTG